MAKTLVVIFGAGASHGCRPEYEVVSGYKVRIPLTNGLFRVPNANHSAIEEARNILLKYSGADVVGSLFERGYRKKPELSLEDYLKELIAGKNENRIRNVREVPFYLRELIGTLCKHIRQEYRQTDYTLLIDYLDNSDYEKIVLITLNYDLLLDWALRDVVHWRAEDMDSYLAHQGKWYYIKLHGSINWIKMLDRRKLRDKCKGTELELLTSFDPNEDFVHSLPIQFNDNQYSYSLGSGYETLLFPVMVLPFGQEKKHICPENHIEKIKPLLQEAEDFWIIGNSMQDSDICDLLSKNAVSAKNVQIIDKPANPVQRKQSIKRVTNCFSSRDGKGLDPMYFDLGFHGYVEQL